MKTLLTEIDSDSISLAVKLLKKGEVVAIPTETVYGLAGNALNPNAVRKIFAAKGRPQDNPLILHISSFEQLKLYAQNIPSLAKKLVESFWPGPLTMIFDKRENVPNETSGGLSTAAFRMPNNRQILDLIDACGFPLAAPSANISGLPSPTMAEHVLRDMNGKIPLILDGGRCEFGVESTVICFSKRGVKILRPGAVTFEMLSELCETEIDSSVLDALKPDQKPISPGMKYKHYSPKAEVVVIDAENDEAFANYVNDNYDENTYVLACAADGIKAKTLPYGASSLQEAAELFSSLRAADELGARKIYVKSPDKNGIGLAVYNRLIRAAAFKVIKL